MNSIVVNITGSPQSGAPNPGPTKLDDFCRVCLLRKASLRPLTCQYEGVMIPEMLFKVSGTLLNILEQLPRVICERCLMKLDLAFHIAEEFRKQEELLRSFCWKGALVDQLVDFQGTEESQRRPYSEGVLEKLIERESEPTPAVVEVEVESIPMPVEEVVVQELSAEQLDDIIERESVGSEPPAAAESEAGYEMVEEEPEPIVKGEPPEAATFSVELIPPTEPLKSEWIEGDDRDEDDDFDEEEDLEAEPVEEEPEEGEMSREAAVDLTQKPPFVPRRYKSTPNENGEFECKECGKTFAVRKTFLNHVRRHELVQAAKFECAQCSKCFGTKERLARHEAIHERDLVCGECGHVCQNGYDYRSHVRSHQTGNFKCRRCLFSTSQRQELLRHNEEECPKRDKVRPGSSGKVVKKPQKCPFEGCDYVASSYGPMYAHKKTKHAPQFQCQVCEKSFPFANRLAEHEKLHTGEMPFQCEYCSKVFRRLFSYKEHIAVHEETSTYDCQLCGKGFNRPRYLAAHMQTHSEERPYVCSICNHRYKTNGELTKHVRSKHDETLDYSKGDDLIEEDYNYFEDDIVM